MAALIPGRSQDAYFSIRGFVYQVQVTIQRWLHLAPGHMLMLERGEDIDDWPEHLLELAEADVSDSKRGELLLEQVKCRQDNATLTSARMSLANFDAHRRKNPVLPLKLRYTTNAKVAREKPVLLTSFTEPGITVWKKLANDELTDTQRDVALKEIRAALLKFNIPKDDASAPSRLVWKNFQETARNCTDAQLLDFVRNVEWETGLDAPEDLKRNLLDVLIKDKWVETEAEAEAVYRYLFLYTFELLSREGEKLLTAADLRVALRKATDNGESIRANKVVNLLEQVNLSLQHKLVETEQNIRSHIDAVDQDIKTHIDDKLEQNSNMDALSKRLDDVWDLLKTGKWNSAESQLEKVHLDAKIIDNPEKRKQVLARIADGKGICRLNLDDMEKAESLFREALRLDPDLAVAQEHLARLLIVTDTAEAIKLSEHARQDPERWSRATATWLRALFQIEGWDRIEEELLRDKSIGGDPECALILGQIKLLLGDVKCAQAYAAIARRGSLPHAAIQLEAESLILPLQQSYRSFQEGGVPDEQWLDSRNGDWSPAAIERIRLVAQLMGDAAVAISGWESVTLRADLLASKAAAELSVGDYEAAAQASEEAMAAVNSHEKASNIRIQTYIANRNPGAALPLLRRLRDADRTYSDRCQSALTGAGILAQENRWEDVIEWLTPFWTIELPGEIAPDVAGLLMAGQQNKKNWDAVATYKADLEARFPIDPLTWVHLARQADRERKYKVALRYMEKAFMLARSATWPRHLRDSVAIDLAYRHAQRKHFRRASILLSPVVDRASDNLPLSNYVVCLHNAGRTRIAQEVARTVRGSGRALPVISEIEADLAYDGGDLGLAIKLRSELQQDAPDKISNLVKLAYLYHAHGNLESARATLKSIPLASIANSPEQLMDLAYARADFGIEDALEYGYRARTLALDDGRIQESYILLCNACSTKDDPLLTIDTVVAECSVHVTLRGKTNVYTLTRTPIMEARDPFQLIITDPVTDDRVKQLMGKKVGDEVALLPQHFGEELHTITEIQSKYIWALHETLALFRQGVFRSNSLMAFEYDPSRPEEMMERMRKLVEQGREDAEEHLNFYRLHPVPLSTIASMRHRSLLECWDHGYGTPFFVSEGTAQELTDGGKAVKQVVAGLPVVLDETAILSIIQFGIAEKVCAWAKTLLVPRAVRDQFAAMVRRVERDDNVQGSLGSNNGSIHFHKYTPEMHAQRVQFWKDALAFIDNSTEVVPVPSSAHADSIESQICTLSTIAAVLLAYERHCPIYSDDLRVRTLASRRKIPGIWTQSLMMELGNSGAVTDEEFARVMENQIVSQYGYLPMASNFLIHVCRRHKWEVNANVLACFSVPSTWFLTDEVALALTADFIWELWQEPLEFEIKRRFIGMAIQALVRDRLAIHIVEQLKLRLKSKDTVQRIPVPGLRGVSLLGEVERATREYLKEASKQSFGVG